MFARSIVLGMLATTLGCNVALDLLDGSAGKTPKSSMSLATLETVPISKFNDYGAMLAEGDRFAEAGDWDAARGAYERCVQLRPVDDEPRSRLSELAADRFATLSTTRVVAARLEDEREALSVANSKAVESIYGDEKAYRLKDARLDSRVQDRSVESRPSPQQAFATKMRQLIANGQKQDQQTRTEETCETNPQRYAEMEQPNETAQPRQVVRADLGMGTNYFASVPTPAARTTGHRGRMVPQYQAGRAFASQQMRCKPVIHVVDTCQPSRASFTNQLALQFR